MTLLRFLNVSTLRYYLKKFKTVVNPVLEGFAIEMTVDFRNPQTVNQVDFITVQKDEDLIG